MFLPLAAFLGVGVTGRFSRNSGDMLLMALIIGLLSLTLVVVIGGGSLVGFFFPDVPSESPLLFLRKLALLLALLSVLPMLSAEMRSNLGYSFDNYVGHAFKFIVSCLMWLITPVVKKEKKSDRRKVGRRRFPPVASTQVVADKDRNTH